MSSMQSFRLLCVVALVVTGVVGDSASDLFFKQLNSAITATEINRPSPASRLSWSCEGFASTEEPSDVHSLKISDIDVVGALGDSITSGNGINGRFLFQVATQVRGESWSIGGDKDIHDVVTIPNMIREYNPDVKGYSIKNGFHNGEDSWLNCAQPGHKSHHMLNQAENLIERLTDPEDTRGIDYENDWKMVTLFVGGNDLCQYCLNRENHSPENYRARIEAALDLMHAEMPRTLVNLVAMMDLTDMHHMSTGFTCDITQATMCNCAISERTRDEQYNVSRGYWQELEALVDSGKYDTRDDFTVVMQPMFAEQIFLQFEDGTYYQDWLAADCFHPNRDTHQIMAVSLWNTMFQPVGEKMTGQLEVPDIYCPVADEFIRTRLN